MLEHGIGHAELDSAADFSLVVFRIPAAVVSSELASAGAAFAAIQNDAGQRVCINTDANSALSEAGLEQYANAQAGFFTVAFAAAIGGGVALCAIAEVTVHVQRAAEYIQLAVFDKAFGLRLGAGESHLGSAGGYCQGEGAPLHHLHGNCSFGLKIFSPAG